jgi:hypothetical protein
MLSFSAHRWAHRCRIHCHCSHAPQESQLAPQNPSSQLACTTESQRIPQNSQLTDCMHHRSTTRSHDADPNAHQSQCIKTHVDPSKANSMHTGQTPRSVTGSIDSPSNPQQQAMQKNYESLHVFC